MFTETGAIFFVPVLFYIPHMDDLFRGISYVNVVTGYCDDIFIIGLYLIKISTFTIYDINLLLK